MEATHGTTLYAVSNSSEELYPENNAAKFTNTLKSQIKLNPNLEYEVKLTNLHVPLYETCLVANDFEESTIKYNIGTFYIDDRFRGSYVLDETSVKPLFTLAPNVNIDGIFS